jgi:hypothetical protein
MTFRCFLLEGLLSRPLFDGSSRDNRSRESGSDTQGQFVPPESNFGGKRTRHFRAGLSYAAAARLEHFARQASRRKVDSESRRTFENGIYVTPSESLVTNPCKI